MKRLFVKQNIRIYFFSIWILCVFFGYQNINALQMVSVQDTITFTELKGTVLDDQDQKPLVYADLNLKGTNIGTITNAEGEFLLKILTKHLNGILVISHLGYHSISVKLSELKEGSNTIYLKEAVTTLGEIHLDIMKDPEALVRETLKRKADNYYNHPAIMMAFYRETIKKRNRNASLSEAVVEVYKEPIKSNKDDAIKLIKARKKTNYSRLDTLALKLQGGPFSNLYTDMIKYPEYVFNQSNLSDYVFKYVQTLKAGANEVYVIDFEQRPEIKYPLYYGKIYIDAKSLALTSAIYKLNVADRELSSEMFVKKKPNRVDAYPTEASYRVDYRIKDGKWLFGYSNIALTFKVKWKRKWFSNTYTLNSEMAITDWEQNVTGIDKPKKRLKPTMILNDEVSGFSDPDFWGEFNIIEPEASIESAINKINKRLIKNGT